MIINKKVAFDYNILEKWDAGISLLGTEVKSLRKGMGSIVNAFALIDKSEVFLLNMNIPKTPFSRFNHDELRKRKLLLKRKEINKMIKSHDKGCTLIPTHVYFNDRGYAKVTIALCVGKKLFDKRRSIKEKEIKREMSKTIKEFV